MSRASVLAPCGTGTAMSTYETSHPDHPHSLEPTRLLTVRNRAASPDDTTRYDEPSIGKLAAPSVTVAVPTPPSFGSTILTPAGPARLLSSARTPSSDEMWSRGAAGRAP